MEICVSEDHTLKVMTGERANVLNGLEFEPWFVNPSLRIENESVYSDLFGALNGYTLLDYEVYGIQVSTVSEGDIEDDTA